MHILLVNDDGPPSQQHSPYVHSLATELQAAGHTVSVILPHVQRSWIGKAHMIDQVLTPSYFRPGTLHVDDGVTAAKPFNDGKEEWVLIDGTPASCVQIGLYHMFQDRGPVDLVLSGPNFGRNTTVLFALSSGTIGGALEGATCGKKSIAISYAFDKSQGELSSHPEIIAGASRLSVRIVEKLMKDWPEDVHLYNVNVPIEESLKDPKVVYTEMLQNQWANGSAFKPIVQPANDVDPGAEEQKIREGANSSEGAAVNADKHSNVQFKWSPRYMDVWHSSKEAGSGDGWAVLQGCVSVTPLRANFWPLLHYKGEVKL